MPILDTSRISAILEKLDHIGETSLDANRRRARRVKFRAPFFVYLPNESRKTPFRIFSRDLSTSGMGFVSRTLFYRGQRIIIMLEAEGVPSRALLAKVVFTFCLTHVRRGPNNEPGGAGLYQVGVEFLECLGEMEEWSMFPKRWTMDNYAPSAEGRQKARDVAKKMARQHGQKTPPAQLAAVPQGDQKQVRKPAEEINDALSGEILPCPSQVPPAAMTNSQTTPQAATSNAADDILDGDFVGSEPADPPDLEIAGDFEAPAPATPERAASQNEEAAWFLS